MKMELKAGLGETIYYLKDNRIHSAEIHGIRVCKISGKISFINKGLYAHPIASEDEGIYYYTCHGEFHEDQVFLSKEALAERYVADLMEE